MPFFDSNDVLSTLSSCMPKDISNINAGQSTHGFWEFLKFYDDVLFNSWMMLANGNLGYLGGLLVVALGSRMIFFPLSLYS